MSKASLVIILAEDERQQKLIRRYLKKLNYNSHEIRNCDLPSGRGCGSQWVLERYPKEVMKYRERFSRARTALVVAIDADTGTVRRRHIELENSLQREGLDVRASSEVIIHLIPKRNIETWILCLNSHHVNENDDYHHNNDIDCFIPRAADTFFEWSRRHYRPPDFCVESLTSAIPEIQSLE